MLAKKQSVPGVAYISLGTFVSHVMIKAFLSHLVTATSLISDIETSVSILSLIRIKRSLSNVSALMKEVVGGQGGRPGFAFKYLRGFYG